MAEKLKYLEAARVTGTHGVRGAVRLECLADSPDVIKALPRLYKKSGDAYVPLTPVNVSVYKGALLTTFEELTSLEAAIPLKGSVLYALRDDIPLPEGTHFIADMLSLPVIDETRGNVGVLGDVIEPAGRQIYVVTKPDGGSFMIPAVPEFIKDIVTDGDGAGIYVRLIDGMIEG